MHTLLDLHGNIPTFIRMTDGTVHDVNILDEFLPEGAFYVMDRGYADFEHLYVFTMCWPFSWCARRRTFCSVGATRIRWTTGVRSDQTVILTAIDSATAYADALRRVSYHDAETDKRLKFLTNNFVLPALTIAYIYKSRWRVELLLQVRWRARAAAVYSGCRSRAAP